MKVTLEQIDELRSRVNVTYEEAKRTLEKNEGDLIKSIIELEKKKGKKSDKEEVKGFIDRLLQLRFSVKNKLGNTMIDIPLVVVLIIFILAFWVVIFGLVLAILTSCKIKIYRAKTNFDVNEIKKNMHETVVKFKEKSEQIIKDEEVPKQYSEDNKNEGTENEITIE
jgi:translation elongation factor EF-Ts